MSNILNSLYKSSLTLLTDFYQLTMAYGYWKNNYHEHEAVFNLFFRKPPFKGGYAICAGLATAIEFLDQLKFTEEDISYLNTIQENNKPLFEPAFLDYLRNLRFTCSVDAIEEGNVVFPLEPLLRVQ